jgi:hypothetical protein
MAFSTAILRISERRKFLTEARKSGGRKPMHGLVGAGSQEIKPLEPLLGLRTGEVERKQESTHGASF